MARIRTVKPEFWTDSRMVKLTPLARLFYIGLWNFADDSGVLENDPGMLRMQVFPGDSFEVEALIDELVGAGRLEQGETDDGIKVLVIPRFLDHQRISHPSPSRFQNVTILREDSGALRSIPGALAQERKGKERKGTRAADAGERFAEFWDAYPLKVAKGAAERAWKSATKSADPEVIIGAAKRYANDPKRSPQYTKHGATWLNAQCWLDDTATPTGTSGVGLDGNVIR